jgi:hypothetical protein
VRFRVGRSARRHKIGNAHILAAIVNAGEPVVVENDLGPQLHYVGADDRGVELHVIAVPDDRNSDGLTVIHAMPTSFTTTTTEEDA